MSKKISIAIDAMGGDNSPDKTIGGVKIFLEKHKIPGCLIYVENNDTLNYFLNNMIKSYSFSPTELYYNAPKSKGTFAISYDNLILPDLWGELSFNYVSKFDFVSGYHVGTENRNISSLSPNLIYENEGPLGGNILMNLKLRYDINDKISIRFILNNITNKDGPRILGTPRIVRSYLLDLNYSL